MSQDPILEMLIRIRDDIAGLDRTRAGMAAVTEEAKGLHKEMGFLDQLGEEVRRGFGIGTGMELARRGIELLNETLQETIGRAFQLATEVKQNATDMGLSIEAYQVFKNELQESGVQMDRLGLAIQTQTQSLAEARAGIGAQADAYKDLHISAAALEGMTTDQRLLAVARAALSATDQTKAMNAAGQILGTRGIPSLLGALNRLATDGYGKVSEEMKEAGRIMSDDTADRLREAERTLETFHQKLTIMTGESIAAISRLGTAFSTDFMGTLGAMLAGPDFLATHIATTIPLPEPTKKPTTQTTASAREELVLQAQLANAQAKASSLQSASLLTETEQRRALLPVLQEQEELTQRLIQAKFGDTAKTLPKDGAVTEADLAAYKQRNELEWQLTQIRQQRMQIADKPLDQLWRSMNDTTMVVQTTITGGIQNGMSQLSSDIWSSLKGVASWGDAWSNLGDVAGHVLSDMIIRLTIAKALASFMGLFQGGGSGAGVNIGTATSVGVSSDAIAGASSTIGNIGASVEAAGAFGGGGSFFTRGPTSIVVGDNPGGVEHVRVTPISGIGQTSVRGRRIAMAGGGDVVVDSARRSTNGSSGDTYITNVSFQFSTGVAATVRAEVMAMSPQLRQLAVDAVGEAHRRNELSLRD